MKYLILFILIISIYGSNYSQSFLLSDPIEIATRTEGFSGTPTIRFTMDPLKQAFCKNYETFNIDDASAGNEEVPGNNSSNNYGFVVCFHTNEDWDTFWITYYQMTIYVDDNQVAYFYLDFRDCSYGGTGCNSNDISIKIKKNGASYELYYAPGLTTDYTRFYEGNLLNWWDINSCSSHTISCFISDPTNISITNSNNHPYVSWQHSTDPNGTYYYEVWRLLTQYSYPSGTWELITTISNKYYTDYDITIGDGSWGRAYYKIRAKIDDLYSNYSSYNYINFEGLQKKGTDNLSSKQNNIYFLFDNFPNPFNPLTRIAYSLPEQTPVQLKIFDPFGKEILNLVNEKKEKGIYEVEFDGTNLTSGIYFYQLKTDKYISTKKMLLVK